VREWRALVAETVSGNVVADVVMSAYPQFSRKLCDKGSWAIDLVVDDKANRGIDFHAFTEPARYSWIVAYNDMAVQAGPVWTYAFKEDSRTLSVAGSGLGGLFGRRVLRNPAGNAATVADVSNDLTYTGLTLASILVELVSDNASQFGYALPLDWPALTPGSAQRTFAGAELANVWDRLTELSQVINGPEFEFAPVLSAGGSRIRWQLVTGSPLLGDSASTSVWDYGAALSAIDIDVNGSASPVTRVWAKGAGQDAATLTGFAENADLIGVGYPGLDYVDSAHTSDTNPDDLTGYAQADAADFRTPDEKWACTVRIDGLINSDGVEISPGFGSWSLGDAPLFGLSGHPWIADGLYRRRILGYTQADPSTLALVIGSTPMVV
jgi:hypothetical protein